MDMIKNLEYHKKMLQAIVDGLVANGWEESGGSDVWRVLHDGNENTIKVFLKGAPGQAYSNPTHIVTRISSEGYNE